MNGKTKIILSIIGLSAVIIPAVLLMVFSSKSQPAEVAPLEKRKIDNQAIQDAVGQPSPIASPRTASPSASPRTFESSPSAGQ